MENFTYKVEGVEENPDPILEKPRLTPEELEQYREEGQKMIDSYRRLFTSFAGDVSLNFRLANAFYIDLEKGEVNLDTSWFADKNCSTDQIIWASLHEIGHFRDLAEDPEGVLKNFDYIKEKSKKTAETLVQKQAEAFKDSDPERAKRIREHNTPLPVKPGKKERMTPAQQVTYKMHHAFYNALDDIYDNNLVARKAPKYEEQAVGGKEVKRLYQEKLFAETDYSKLPRHLQLIYKLLREEMVKDEEAVVSDEVKEALERPITFHGKQYTAKEIVEAFLKPKGGRDTKARQRHFVIRQTLESIFEELLQKDLADWDPKKEDEKQQEEESAGGEVEPSESINPFEQEYEEFEKNNPDQISEEDIRKWVDKHEKEKEEEKRQAEKKKTEVSKTPEQKSQEAQEGMDKRWAKEHRVDYGDLRKLRQIEGEIEPYLEELSDLWRRIVMGSTPIVERGQEGHFKTGQLDVPKVIGEWPRIERRELDDVRVMKRMVNKETLIQKPELIRVRLVGDMSGSMAGNEAKLHTLQQCFVLILSSLQEFNTYLNLNRARTKTKLEVDTEAWIFGDTPLKIKKLRSEVGLESEQVEIPKIFNHLKREKDMGSTYDDKVLAGIGNALTPEEKDKIAKEKLMEIVFEITDGGSSKPAEAKAAVDKLSGAGVITRAFQIGETNSSEKQCFEQVWNENRVERLGEIVGSDIGNLIPALTAALKKYLGNVRL